MDGTVLILTEFHGVPLLVSFRDFLRAVLRDWLRVVAEAAQIEQLRWWFC